MKYQEFVSGTLHSLWMDYFEEVLDFAGMVFEQCVVPFCDERDWAFSSGMGTWCLGPSWESNEHRDDEKWQEIAAILKTPVKGYDYDIGSLMPDYGPEDTDE